LSKDDFALVRFVIVQSPASLPLAAQGGHKEVVEFPIGKGAKINERDIAGETPLHYAVQVGNPTMARLVIEKGAYINRRNKFGVTPLNVACDSGQNEAAQLIASKGSFLSRVDDPGVVRLSENAYSISFPHGNRTNLGVFAGGKCHRIYGDSRQNHIEHILLDRGYVQQL
jgi:ankyrin repeat protein